MRPVRNKARGKGAVVIYYLEQVGEVRRHMRTVLGQWGFGTIEEFSSLAGLLEAFDRKTPDLLLLDCSTAEAASLVRDIRYGRFGEDPFLPIIATLWSPTADDVKTLAQNGPDDVVIKPMAANTLLERVGALIHSRKNFVFTEAYVGPDRRADPKRRKESPNVRAVPNRLATKVKGGEIDEAALTALRAMIPAGETRDRQQDKGQESNSRVA